ncbi:MAG: transglutaminase-like domain-containing protein [Luteibaculaceae bacterium]
MSANKNKSEIEALIQLLDDPDTFVYESARKRLLSHGVEIVPLLEGFWEQALVAPQAQDSLIDIIHQIQITDLGNQFLHWKNTGANSLLKGSMLVAKYQFPELDEESITSEISQLASEIWLELNDNLTALEQVKVFNYFFFGKFQFSGNKKHYHAPQNNFVNYVIDSKRGNPLSLSIVYLLIAQKLNLPVFGINLPSHFILGWAQNHNPKAKEDILFYVNPFSKGVLLQYSDLEKFITQLQIPFKADYFMPCTPLSMVERQLNNLSYAYSQQGFLDKVQEIERFKDLLKG